MTRARLEIPVAPTQSLFWAIDRRYGGATAHSAILIDAPGALQGDALTAALERVVLDEPSLRTGFELRDGSVVAAVHEGARPDVRFVDCAEDALAAIFDASAREPFDLASPPLVRFTVARLPQRTVILAVFHHIVSDGTSMWRLYPAELARHYSALLAGAPLAEPSARASYREFAERTLAANSGAAVQPLIEFWRSELAGRPTSLDLPTDHLRPSQPSGRGARVELPIAPALRARLHARAQELGVRPLDLYMTAYAALLGRAGRTEDVLLGVPHANRAPEFREVHGCFADTTVARLDLSGGPSFADAARRCYAMRGRTRTQRGLSSSVMLEALVDANDSPTRPIYQAMFNYLDFGLGRIRLGEVEAQIGALDVGVAMSDLALDLFDAETRPFLRLEFDTDLFTHATATRYLTRLTALLDAALEDPSRRIAELPVVDEEERASMLGAFQGAPIAAPQHETVVHEIARVAEASPDAPALISGDRTISYRELRERSREIARALAARGHARGGVVAVDARDKLSALTGVIGALEAGAAYLPIDPDLPDARAHELVRSAGARFVLSDLRPYPSARSGGVEVLDLGALPAAPEGTEPSPPRPEDPAYVLFTSGSTGTPKGVVVLHRNLSHQLQSRRASYPGDPSRFLFTYSLAFDASVAGLFWTLCSGGALLAIDEVRRKDPPALARLIRELAPSHLDFVPTLYDAVLAVSAPGDLASVTTVTLGGEVLDLALAQRHFTHAPAARLFNEYGPTETTVFSTIHEVQRGDARVPIGRLAPGTLGYVLDGERQLVPIGHDGELYIGGGGVTAGYIGRPDLDAEAFISAAVAPGVRLYKTGDRVRWNADGTLDFRGRVDRQFKLRGFRIELGEIEAKMGQLAGVERAAVAVQKVTSGADLLVGYFQPASGAKVEPEGLRAELKRVLPAHMIPSAWVRLDAMPIGRTGKIDYAKLPPSVFEARRAQRVPTTDLERRVASIWSDVLGARQPALEDDFFEAGGHSLLAVKLLSKIERELGRTISVVTLFEGGTLGALVRALERGPGERVQLRALESIRTAGSARPLFFVGSTAQARALAPHIDRARPMYGLNIFGLYRSDRASIELEEIARTYVEEIRRVQPRGPYLLTGYCAEATLALEMAVQLDAIGESIAYLGFIDGLPFVEMTESKPARLIRNLKNDGLDYVAQMARRRGQAVWRKSHRLRARVERALGGTRASLSAHHLRWVEIYNRAVELHRPRAYSGSISLILTTEVGEVDLSGMSGLASGGVEVERVQAYHDTLFVAPGVARLGDLMSKSMDRAEARARR